jgi:hypothetical protein
MFVIVDHLMSSTSFYALITGYLIVRTMFEPVDVWVLTAYEVFDYMSGLLPVTHDDTTDETELSVPTPPRSPSLSLPCLMID